VLPHSIFGKHNGFLALITKLFAKMKTFSIKQKVFAKTKTFGKNKTFARKKFRF
jgi:hypothetical protein